MKIKDFMSLQNEVLELLDNENMLAIRGGFTDKTEINSRKTCSAVNNGKNCDVINDAKSCILINNSEASCSVVNTTKTCTVTTKP